MSGQASDSWKRRGAAGSSDSPHRQSRTSSRRDGDSNDDNNNNNNNSNNNNNNNNSNNNNNNNNSNSYSSPSTPNRNRRSRGGGGGGEGSSYNRRGGDDNNNINNNNNNTNNISSPSTPNRERNSRTGGTGGGGGDGSARRGSRGARNRPSSSKREQGFVESLKEDFGFIQTTTASTEDLFFHYSELKDHAPNDLRVGDEVEFFTRIRGQRTNAADVRVLPQGTIVLDKIVFPASANKRNTRDNLLYGIITHELRRVNTRDNRHQQQQQTVHPFSGRICVTPSKEIIDVETLAIIYTNHIDMAGTGGGLASSLSSSSAAVSGATDTNAPVINEVTSATESGAVVCFGERGLMQPAAPNNESVSETKTPNAQKFTRARPGDLVSFVLGSELATGKLHALQVTIVKSAAQLQTDLVNAQIEANKNDATRGGARVLGEVVSIFGSAENVDNGSISSTKNGLIRMVGAPTKIAFEFSQVPEANRPLDAPVVPVPTAPQAVSSSNNSVISNWRSSGTAAQSNSRFANEWKRNTGEPVDNLPNSSIKEADNAGSKDEASLRMKVGTLVEFDVVMDPARKGGKLAVCISVLDPKNITPDETIFAKVCGVVGVTRNDGGGSITFDPPLEIKPKMSKANKKKRSGGDDGGDVESDVGEEGVESARPKQPISHVDFSGVDVITTGPKALKNDTVCCNVVFSPMLGHLRATAVYLSVPKDESVRAEQTSIDPFVSSLKRVNRETGEVIKLRESFGFIQRMDVGGDVFFPFNEVVAAPYVRALAAKVGHKDGQKHSSMDHMRQQPLQKGDVVSFSVVEQTASERGGSLARKAFAARVVQLPKGTVRRKVLLQAQVNGRIAYTRSQDNADSEDVTNTSPNGYLRKSVPAYSVSLPLTTFVSKPLFETLFHFVDPGYLGPNNKIVNKIIAKLSPAANKKKVKRTAVLVLGKSVDEDVMTLIITPPEWELVRQYARALGLTCTIIGGSNKSTDSPSNSRIARLIIERGEGNGADQKIESVADGTEGASEKVSSAAGESNGSLAGGGDSSEKETSTSNSAESTREKQELVHNVVLKMPRSFGAAFEPPAEGDPVLLDVFIDKVTLVMEVQNVQRLNRDGSVYVDLVAEKAAEEAEISKIEAAAANELANDVSKGSKIEVFGVVACIKKEGGFGFIQCSTRPIRMFFSLQSASFVDASLVSNLKPGTRVAFVTNKTKQGMTATRIRKLERIELGGPNGEPAIDVSDVPDVTLERVRGVVVSARNRSVILQNSRSDCVDALRIQASHMSSNLMGQIVIGDVDDVVTSANAKASSAPDVPAVTQVDWRRETELINKVREFANSPRNATSEVAVDDVEGVDEVFNTFEGLELDLTSTAEERVVKKAAKKAGVHVASLSPDKATEKGLRVVLARSKDSLRLYVANTVSMKAAEDAFAEATAAAAAAEEEETTSADGADDDSVEVSSAEAPAALKEEKPPPVVKTVDRRPYCFTVYDLIGKALTDRGLFVNDQVEFIMAVNVATKIRRALNVTLVSDAGTGKRTGVVDAAPYGGRFGFVRADVVDVPVQDEVDENGDVLSSSSSPVSTPTRARTKLETMSRGQTVKFDVSEVIRNVRLNQGDRVEFYVISDPRTNKNKAVRVKLVKRAETKSNTSGGAGSNGSLGSGSGRKVINKSLIEKLRVSQEQVAIPKFVQAKGPDGTLGFAPGRGRVIPSGLRPTAREYTPPGVRTTTTE